MSASGPPIVPMESGCGACQVHTSWPVLGLTAVIEFAPEVWLASAASLNRPAAAPWTSPEWDHLIVPLAGSTATVWVISQPGVLHGGTTESRRSPCSNWFPPCVLRLKASARGSVIGDSM